MNLAALILVTLLGGISIYDFYVLKKAKVKTLICLSSAGITLVVNAVLFIIGLMIGSAIFGEDNDIYLIVSVILVAGVSFFRFIGRDLNKLKKDKLDKLFRKKKLLLNLSKTDSRLIKKTKKVCSNNNKIFMSLYKEKLIKKKYEVSR